jgi:hypothetical protein
MTDPVMYCPYLSRQTLANVEAFTALTLDDLFCFKPESQKVDLKSMLAQSKDNREPVYKLLDSEFYGLYDLISLCLNDDPTYDFVLDYLLTTQKHTRAIYYILLNGIKSGNLRIVNKCINADFNMELRNKGKSFLYYACKYGQYEIAKLLIKYGLLNNQCSWNPKISVVDVAIRKCQWRLLDLLLRSGANIHTIYDREVKLLPSYEKYEPLLLATLDPFADANNPICTAASSGYHSIFRYWMVKYPKRYSLKNLLKYSGSELLYNALFSRNPLLIEHLLEMGIECPQYDGSSIVDYFLDTVTSPSVLTQYGGQVLSENIYLTLILQHYNINSYFSYLTPQLIHQIYIYIQNNRILQMDD